MKARGVSQGVLCSMHQQCFYWSKNMSDELRRSNEEVGLLGSELYQKILPQLAPEDKDKYVAIDLNTGNYEVNAYSYAACAKLKEREPAADVWLERAGFPAAIKMGLRIKIITMNHH